MQPAERAQNDSLSLLPDLHYSIGYQDINQLGEVKGINHSVTVDVIIRSGWLVPAGEEG